MHSHTQPILYVPNFLRLLFSCIIWKRKKMFAIFNKHRGFSLWLALLVSRRIPSSVFLVLFGNYRKNVNITRQAVQWFYNPHTHSVSRDQQTTFPTITTTTSERGREKKKTMAFRVVIDWNIRIIVVSPSFSSWIDSIPISAPPRDIV